MMICDMICFFLNVFSKISVSNCAVGHILLKMVQELCWKHWCAVPLLFLSQALSKLPPSPLLGIGGLAALRCLCIRTITLCPHCIR